MSAGGWIVRFQSRPEAQVRLFCFPHAGAGSIAYRAWANDVPDHIEVLGVLPPGRETRLREPPFTDVVSLVSGLAADIDDWLDRPYALFGHSVGAVEAFEAARRLEREAPVPPLLLVASGRAAPQLPSRGRLLHALTDRDLIEAIGRMNGSPPAVLGNAELTAVMLPVLRADLRMNESYVEQAAAQLSVPIRVFGGTDDMTVREADLAQWALKTRAGFRLTMFDGDHFFVQTRRREVIHAVVSAIDEHLHPGGP